MQVGSASSKRATNVAQTKITNAQGVMGSIGTKGRPSTAKTEQKVTRA